MISCDENALICDLAETYHIFDYRSLPVKTAATLAAGLREDSRIKMKLTGREVSQDTLLMGVIADRIGLLIYQLGGADGDPPESIAEKLMNVKDENAVDTFDSPEEFRAAWNKITGGQ